MTRKQKNKNSKKNKIKNDTSLKMKILKNFRGAALLSERRLKE
ncbi:hypothetical protein WMO25_09050 [Coprococcus sp. CLA-AA-H190]|uniref:Uncharacterized protein n=1 Tax=Coprococcus intestinihominis TaxID=3133154 RepID=A0ABV1B483_9FIRM